MTNLTKSTATAALIALMSAAPALASPESGSPQQSIAADPDEYAVKKPVTTESVTSQTASGTPAKSVDADANESVAASNETDGTLADELPTNSPVLNDS